MLGRTCQEYCFTVEQLLSRRVALEREIAAIAQQAPYREPVGWLRCFRGFDSLGALTVLIEIGDFQRFGHPRGLMAYLGLVPSEASTGERARRGSITKAGKSHVRRILVEAGWHARHPPRLGKALSRRSQGQPAAVLAQAWRAQQRFHRRYRHLIGHAKQPPVAVVAIARELVGFLWAALTRTEPAAQAA